MNHSQYIVERLDVARDERGMSVAELARRTDVPVKRLRYIFNGDRQLRADEFVRLCVVLNMGTRQFVPREMLDRYEATGKRMLEDFGFLTVRPRRPKDPAR